MRFWLALTAWLLLAVVTLAGEYTYESGYYWKDGAAYTRTDRLPFGSGFVKDDSGHVGLGHPVHFAQLCLVELFGCVEGFDFLGIREGQSALSWGAWEAQSARWFFESESYGPSGIFGFGHIFQIGEPVIPFVPVHVIYFHVFWAGSNEGEHDEVVNEILLGLSDVVVEKHAEVSFFPFFKSLRGEDSSRPSRSFVSTVPPSSDAAEVTDFVVEGVFGDGHWKP